MKWFLHTQHLNILLLKVICGHFVSICLLHQISQEATIKRLGKGYILQDGGREELACDLAAKGYSCLDFLLVAAQQRTMSVRYKQPYLVLSVPLTLFFICTLVGYILLHLFPSNARSHTPYVSSIFLPFFCAFSPLKSLFVNDSTPPPPTFLQLLFLRMCT